MGSDKKAGREVQSEGPLDQYLKLRPETVESVFTTSVMDLREILVLDGVDILPDGFRIRSHDRYGPMPEIVIENSGNTFRDKETLGTEVCKLIAMVGLRDQMVVWQGGGEFLEPTMVERRALVGFKVRERTWVAEGGDYLAGYHELRRKVVG